MRVSTSTFPAGAQDRGGRYFQTLQWRPLPHRLPLHRPVNQVVRRRRDGEGAGESLKEIGGSGSGRRQTILVTGCKDGIGRQKSGDKHARRPQSVVRSTGRPEKTCLYEGGLDATLEKRFLRLKAKLQEYAKADSLSYILESEVRVAPDSNKGKKTSRRVSWADYK